jgi:hypothetical protein
VHREVQELHRALPGPECAGLGQSSRGVTIVIRGRQALAAFGDGQQLFSTTK